MVCGKQRNVLEHRHHRKGEGMNTAVEPSEAVGMSARRLEGIRPVMQSFIDRGVYAGINM